MATSCLAQNVVSEAEVNDRLHHLFSQSQNDLVVYCGNITVYFRSCDAFGCDYENLTFSDCDSYNSPDGILRVMVFVIVANKASISYHT